MPVLRGCVLCAALIAALMLGLSGPGIWMDLWDWRFAFKLLKWAAYAGMATAALSVLMLLIPRTRRGGAVTLGLALVASVIAAAPPIALLKTAEGLPDIHDITTDTENPPAFVALLAERRASRNGADYGGEKVASEQKKGYPDIQPIVVAQPPAQAFARALEAARQMGWAIASDDAASGRIEATATTYWFRFKDDVVVRVRPEGSGSRIDVRSVSRVGSSDVGANAKRIREYRSRLS